MRLLIFTAIFSAAERIESGFGFLFRKNTVHNDIMEIIEHYNFFIYP